MQRAGVMKLPWNRCAARTRMPFASISAAARQLPADLRDQPALVEDYVQTMVAIARLFEQRLGDASLMRTLTGAGGDNPLVRWQQRLDQAQKAMEELQYREAAGQLADLLIDVRGLKGSGPEAYLPPTFGLLGECYFQCGEAEKAVAPTEQALRICRRTGDKEGVATYLGNLYEIHRYRGDCQRAGDAAEELAERLAENGRADRGRAVREPGPAGARGRATQPGHRQP